jgi:peptidoglycan/LPS O-acetylase OafA/YrhL
LFVLCLVAHKKQQQKYHVSLSGDANDKEYRNKAVPAILACCGSDAVGIFFALSGFVMVYAYEKCKDFDDAGCRATFWLKRLARVGPLYTLCLLTSLNFLIDFGKSECIRE